MTRSDVTEEHGKLCGDDAPARGTGGSKGFALIRCPLHSCRPGLLDDIIQPNETRKKLTQALAMVEN
jgi:hypothetical protein